MNLILKYKKEIVVSVGLIAIYFFSRLIHLGNFPIFTDEAIYVRWAQIASNDAAWRFISLTDGKQPMFVWVAMILIKVIEDPLLASRIVSVFAGFFTLFGLWFLSFELFKDKKIAFLTAFLYICFPFAVVYDRLALYDSMVGAFAVWAAYISILLVRKIRLDVAFILGFVLAGGMLTKSNANFSILMLPFTLILFNFKKFKKINLVKWAVFAFIAVAMAEVFYNALRLSPFFHIIAEKNVTFVYPISEWINHPFTFFFGNLKGLSGWLFTYLTPLFVLAIVLSFFSKTYIKEKILLLLYFLAPYIALALFGKVIFPRHIFFTSLYLLPLVSVGIFLIINFLNNYFQKRKLNVGNVVAGLVILAFTIYPIKISLDFIFNPMHAAIANSDRGQLIADWPSGGGVKESVVFFNEQAKNGPIFIGTQGTFGLMPASLDIYLSKNPNVRTKGYWPVGEEIPEDVLKMASKMPTYFIFYQPCGACKFSGEAPADWPVTPIKRIQKSDNVFYTIYKVNPNN